MPPCPEGFLCPMVMPARQLVTAQWSSSNPLVAAVTNPAPTGLVRGVSQGNADIKAVYTIPGTNTTLSAGASIYVKALSVASPVTVLSPNGGEALTKGQSYVIKWVQTGFASSDGWIQLQLRDAVDSSKMVKLITPSVPLGTYAGSFNWTIPTDIPDGKYLMWATAGSGLDSLGTRVVGSDFSDAPFTISTTPNNAADASSGGSSFAALLLSLERQLEELERLLNSLLP